MSFFPAGADFAVSFLLPDPATAGFVSDVLAAATAPFPVSYKDESQQGWNTFKLLRIELQPV